MATSSGTNRSRVKAVAANGSEKAGIARHFDGWQPGLLALFLAGVSAAIAVPRGVAPHELPEPLIEPRALAQIGRADDALAARAEAAHARHEPLPFEVRALGSAIVAYGLAEAGGDDVEVVAARRRVAEAARAAKPAGEGPLLELRAYECREFLRALRTWEAQGKDRIVAPDLHELGGTFVETAIHHGWTLGRALAMDEPVRRAMFKKRWNELTMFRGPGFDLSSDELRALHRFLLARPPLDPLEPAPTPGGRRKASERAEFVAEQYRLKKIDDLAAVDPSYPADLARGIVFFRMHRYPAATEHLSRHLDAHPEGPYAQRATNYLRASLARSHEDLP